MERRHSCRHGFIYSPLRNLPTKAANGQGVSLEAEHNEAIEAFFWSTLFLERRHLCRHGFIYSPLRNLSTKAANGYGVSRETKHEEGIGAPWSTLFLEHHFLERDRYVFPVGAPSGSLIKRVSSKLTRGNTLLSFSILKSEVTMRT